MALLCRPSRVPLQVFSGLRGDVMEIFMKKNDILLIIFILALGFLISFFSSSHNSVTGTTVKVRIDGQNYKTFSLSEEGHFIIETDFGSNELVIEGGRVYICNADCDGEDCIRMGKISRKGERLVCLPHHLEIYIEGDDSDVDTVAY